MGHDHGHGHGHGHDDGHGHGHGHDHDEPLVVFMKWCWKQISPAQRRLKRNYQALAEAINNADTAQFSALLENGADFDFTPKGKSDIALLCVENGTPEMLEALLAHGLDPNMRLSHTIKDAEENKDVISQRCPILSHAIEQGSEPMAMALLKSPTIDTNRSGVTVRSESRGYRMQFHPYPLDLARAFNMQAVAKELEARNSATSTPCTAQKAKTVPALRA